METITIQKEVRIPGTDIILEKGDVIKVLPRKKESRTSTKKRKTVLSEEAKKRIRERMKAKREKNKKEE